MRDSRATGPFPSAVDTILSLCSGKIRVAFKQRAPMPIIVLRSQDPTAGARNSTGLSADAGPQAAANVVKRLSGIYHDGRIPCRLTVPRAASPDNGGQPGSNNPPPVSLSVYGPAIEIVRDLAAPDKWNMSFRTQYKPFTFPRSDKLRAIEDAVGVDKLLTGGQRGAPGSGSREPVSRRRNQGRKAHSGPGDEEATKSQGIIALLREGVSPSSTLGALLVAAASVKFFNVVSTGLLAIVFLAAFALLAVAAMITAYRAPLALLRPANWWFTWTTFIGPVGELPDGISDLRWQRLGLRGSWRVHQARVRFVRGQLKKAQGDFLTLQEAADLGITTQEAALRFCLQLRVLALLEDLRANHRRWTLDLRGLKRTWPPMLFLPAVDSSPASQALLQAISDVRSRRSEQDPLLVVTASQRLHKFEHVPEPTARPEAGARYTAWLTRIRINQSPSLGSSWPWIMDYPFTPEALENISRQLPDPFARRSLWNLWSRWSLAFLVAVTVVLCLHANTKLGEDYCGGGILNYFDSRHDIVSIAGTADNPTQCVGIEVNDTEAFVPPGGGVSLADTLPVSSASCGDARQLSNVTLATVEQCIDEQNEEAEQSGHYVTFVYAGPLTAAAGQQQEKQTLNAVKEIAAMCAWQFDNIWSGDPIKVRIDIANGGLYLNDQQVMAEKIVTAALHDSSIVGVIGLGRDTLSSQAVVRELARTGLPVVGTTNTDDYLPKLWSYFGMAATNAEEVSALAPLTGRAANHYAVVLERSTRPADPYSEQQAAAAVTMLQTEEHFTLIHAPGRPPGPVIFSANDSSSDIGAAVTGGICEQSDKPSVVYLAGRSDDLAELLDSISQSPQCFAQHVIVLSGDDLTKNEFNESPDSYFPNDVMVYYTALTNTAKTAGSPLVSDIERAFGVTVASDPTSPTSSTSPYGNAVFADGTLALAFDATAALYKAATDAYSEAGGQPDRVGTAAVLRCLTINGATGTVGFTGVHHGIQVMQVTPPANGSATPGLQPYGGPSLPGDHNCAPPISQSSP